LLEGGGYRFVPKKDLLGKASEKLLKKLAEFRKGRRAWGGVTLEQKMDGVEVMIRDGFKE